MLTLQSDPLRIFPTKTKGIHSEHPASKLNTTKLYCFTTRYCAASAQDKVDNLIVLLLATDVQWETGTQKHIANTLPG